MKKLISLLSILMMSSLFAQNIMTIESESRVVTDHIDTVKFSSARADTKRIPYLSVKGLNGEECRITEASAKYYGLSLGEVALLLAKDKTKLKCSYASPASFPAAIELEFRP
jgi:hypothetical protein